MMLFSICTPKEMGSSICFHAKTIIPYSPESEGIHDVPIVFSPIFSTHILFPQIYSLFFTM